MGPKDTLQLSTGGGQSKGAEPQTDSNDPLQLSTGGGQSKVADLGLGKHDKKGPSRGKNSPFDGSETRWTVERVENGLKRPSSTVHRR